MAGLFLIDCYWISSIQRKVGYLKMMEQDSGGGQYKWETHLDDFRVVQTPKIGPSAHEERRHSFVTTVGIMLTVINLFGFGLYCWGPIAQQTDSGQRSQGWIDVCIFAMLVGGFIYALYKRSSLTRGQNTSKAIAERWRLAINRTKPERT